MMRQDIMAQEEETVHTIEGRGQSVKQEQGTSFRLQLHSPSDLLVPAQPCHLRLRGFPLPNVTRVQCMILATVLHIQIITRAKLM